MKRIVLGIAVLLLTTPAGYCMRPVEPLQLTITSDKQVYEVGEDVKLTIKATNIGIEDVYIDGGNLEVSYEIRNNSGEEIKEIPFLDEIYEMPGAESFWKLYVGGIRKSTTTLWIKNGSWKPLFTGDAYKGIAIHVLRTAGQSVYPLEKIPGIYRISLQWIIDGRRSQERAKEFGFRNVLLDSITSNTITIEGVEKKADKPETFIMDLKFNHK